jgi:polysaccharide deacetylase 2 family uncharacterized protein YibQ
VSQTLAMFSRKPQPKPAQKAAVGARNAQPSPLLAALSNPYISAGGSAFLFLAAVAVLIAMTGDPKAGAPVVRLDLMKLVSSPNVPAGWREALSPELSGEAPLEPDTYALSATAPEDPAAFSGGPTGGQAIITMTGGGSDNTVPISALALPQSPIAGLTTAGPGGLLPIIGPGGLNASQAYARPFVGNGKPKVSLVIGGLGLNAQATRAAIESLPPEVTLSFVPYAEGLQGWIDLARAAGHEVLLEAPMEPNDYPNNDPGPYTLMTDAAAPETTRKLEWLLSRCTGYFGVTNYLGSKFVASGPAMGNLASALHARGLAFVDDGSAAHQRAAYLSGLPRLSADRIVDDQLSADTIQAQLTQLESGAMQKGQAMGSGFAYPVTIEVAARWAAGLADRGFQLAPASALMRRE